ncbi:DUF3943 domain-containing protein [Vibrio tapetis]|uniref:DUF3943 domain-containing protein n=1 Tax=Vibrio tapetis subsp. tapetis TaxID=1671868 RepID=A0A2N8Z946_9VIBR|nr:DUF3943 domain-containing protein [Vibrio tapetis]SON48383.1 conserved exported protein of unknown function [Vibrio tapetis subsp. tapetis]
MHLKPLTAILLACSTSAHAANLNFDFNDDFSSHTIGYEAKNYSLISGIDSIPVSLSYEDHKKEKIEASSVQPPHLYALEEKDWEYLREQTYTILGLSIATVGIMTVLPESITKWDAEDRDLSNLGKKWKDNVSAGPVWDRDEHILNYIMHPYFGGVYYTAGRHAGFNEFESFLYSFTMSAVFWDFGVESFAEIPSWQDLFITPFFGAVVGEMMFTGEQNIIANGGEVMGSETMGDVSLFFLNPVGHIHYWVTDAWGGDANLNFRSQPWTGYQTEADKIINPYQVYDRQFYGLDLTITF